MHCPGYPVTWSVQVINQTEFKDRSLCYGPVAGNTECGMWRGLQWRKHRGILGWRLITILERASHWSIASNVAKRISLHLPQKMELSLFPLLFSLILAWISSPSASSVPSFLHSGWEVLPPIQCLFSWPRSSRLSIMYAPKPSCRSQELSSSLAWDKNPILVCSYKWEA